IWSLAKELWSKKHSHWPEPSLGGILGCSLANFQDEKGKPSTATSRLYHILISETIFEIWKIRNDIIFDREGTPFPLNAIHNRWLGVIHRCLLLDGNLTNSAKYGKQSSVKLSHVLETWKSTLMKFEDDLPENWVKMPGVLVGIGPKSSHRPP
ncbi:hypothetical protein B0H19DRAFT_866465, partial [Mycena capillaripes]